MAAHRPSARILPTGTTACQARMPPARTLPARRLTYHLHRRSGHECHALAGHNWVQRSTQSVQQKSTSNRLRAPHPSTRLWVSHTPWPRLDTLKGMTTIPEAASEMDHHGKCWQHWRIADSCSYPMPCTAALSHQQYMLSQQWGQSFKTVGESRVMQPARL